MLPDPRQVGEPQIDHLDVLVLDRLQEIFGCRTILNHGFTPATLEWRSKIVLPFSHCHAAPEPFWYTFQLGAAAPASIWHGGARIQARLATREPEASALVRPAHKLHGVFDVPPVFGQFHLALCFKFDGVLSGFRNGLRAVCFQQLSRIVMDFDFSHGVTLLLFSARP
jgi:hypothetical protein